MTRIIFTLICMFLFSGAFPQDNNAELTFQKTDILYRNGRLFTNIAYEIKILNRAGEAFTKVSLPYSGLIKISKLEACIKDASGKIIKKLAKSDITDINAVSDMSLYEDNFIKEFTLKHNSYPYIISYSYQLQQEEFLHIGYWVPVISAKVPTLNAVLNVEVPRDYKVHFISQLTDTFSSDTTDSQIKYTWSASFKDHYEPELFSPSLTGFMPKVIIVPDRFNYSIAGSFESWLTFGKWIDDLLKGLSDLPANEKTNIRKLTEGISDTRQKVKVLYNYLQDNTRYINVTIETGGLKPYPASYVAENKYGDCKALSNYFKAVLDVAGLPSYYTLVNAGNPSARINKSFPSQQFNHIILCIPTGNDTIWADCTSDNAFGYSGTFIQGREVLIINDNRSYFSKTPDLSPGDVRETRRVSIRQSNQDQAVAMFTNSYRGEKYEELYYLMHSLSESRKSQYFRNNLVENGFELTDLNLTGNDRDSAEISVSFKATSDKIYKHYGRDLLINVISFLVPRFEDPGIRKLPVQIDYPVSRCDTLEFEIPLGYTLTSDLTNQAISGEFGRYSIASSQKGNKLEIIKSFTLYSGEYPLERYRDFYGFINSVTGIEKNNKIVANKN